MTQLHYEKRPDESWLDYQRRLLHELDAWRTSQGFHAQLDVANAECMALWYGVYSAKDADEAWSLINQWRGAVRVYNKMRYKADELERYKDELEKRQVDTYPGLQESTRQRQAAVNRRRPPVG